MSAEFCKKVSDGKKGHKTGMTGKQHSEETKKIMRDKATGVKGPQKRIEYCPNCLTYSVTARHIKFCKGTK